MDRTTATEGDGRTAERVIMSWVEELRAGNAAAASILLQVLDSRIEAACARVIHSRNRHKLDGADLAQEVRLRLLIGISKFEGDSIQALMGWLHALVRHCAIDMVGRGLKHKAQVSSIDRTDQDGGRPKDRLADSGTSPSGRVLRKERGEIARGLLERLRPADREVLELRYLDGLTIAEIAERLELDPNAVNQRIHRAMVALRRLTDGTL